MYKTYFEPFNFSQKARKLTFNYFESSDRKMARIMFKT